tara:strand:+ start:400 stop:576 length:177 start_codon:yes stop_codon:yes gene_type:complete
MNLQQKIEQIQAELQVAAEKHNQLNEQKNTLFNQVLELQGALKVLIQLKEEENGGTNG